MRLTAICLLGTVFVASTPAFADSCMPLFAGLQKGSSRSIVFVTLNNVRKANENQNTSFASYASGSVSYAPAFPFSPGKPGRPASLGSDVDFNQLFSDRSGANGQGFDTGKADKVSINISIGDTPTVKLTLKSWGNSVLTFPVTCSSNRVMHGVAKDADYLITLLDPVLN